MPKVTAEQLVEPTRTTSTTSVASTTKARSFSWKVDYYDRARVPATI